MAVQRRRLRTFQERKNVLELYDDRELIKRYRLDHQGILFVTDLVRNSITPQTIRNNALTAELKVIMTLRFLATGKMQQCTSDDLGSSQSTVSRVLNGTIAALTTPNIVIDWLPNWPSNFTAKARSFYENCRLPRSCWSHRWHSRSHNFSNCKWGGIRQ